MTPAARVQAAIEILDTVLTGAPTEQTLIRWARSHRFAGSKDRAAVRDLVFSAIRCKISFAAMGGSLTGRGLMIGAMRAQGADVAMMFDGSTYGPPPLTEAEFLQQRSFDQLPVEHQVDLQAWVWQRFQDDLGPMAFDTAMALRSRAEVFLRVNFRKCDVKTAADQLKDEGIDTAPHPLAGGCLRVLTNARRVALSKAYSTGMVELQDAGSQAVCQFLKVPEHGQILDFCAGGGGKSLAMAARSNAEMFAYDVHAQRMMDLPGRARKAGVSIEIMKEIPSKRQFDLVFCDVPCSGSGSWRRTPDGKWMVTPGGLDKLLETQAHILKTASKLTKIDGELAYATCSVLSSENAEQIDRFVQANPDWHLICDRQFLPQDGGDGFYVARLTRA